MGDMGELFNGLKEHSKKKRESNRNFSKELLKKNGVTFEEKNAGAHLIVDANGSKIDFWPGTGLWIARKPHKTGRGVNGLMAYINKIDKQDSQNG